MNKTLLALTLLCIGAPAFTVAADVGESPVITMTTSLYQQGSENYLVFHIGSIQQQTVKIDGGYGPVEFSVGPAVYNPETQSIDAPFVAAPVSEEGVVRLYAEDASLIDYLDMEGCYISSISMPTLVNLDVLSMDHNELGALDLSPFSKLTSLSLSDNPFNVTPLKVGEKPNLTILTLDQISSMDSSFSLTDYPNLMSFTAWGNKGLHKVDTSKCPRLARLSIDNTDVESVDLSNNPELQILNISDTRITDVDLSVLPKLHQFYCEHQSSTDNPDIKISKIDVSKNPELVYLYCAGNLLTELDLSANTQLMMLNCSHNQLTALDLSKNEFLINVNFSYNYMDYASMPMNPGTWGDLIWEQNPMKVDYSYPEGASIDLSKRVIIPQETTYMSLRGYSIETPGEDYEIEETAYTFKDGILTLHEAMPDSLRAEFYNPLFPDATLNTTKFMVKSADDFGKPTVVSDITTVGNPGDKLAMRIGALGASEANPLTVLVDFGDGSPREFKITTQSMPVEPNVVAEINGYGTKHLLVPDGVNITALGINSGLYRISTNKLTRLLDLDLSGAGLYDIDLRYNNYLNRLNLADNNFSAIDLSGFNNAYNKQWLADINLSNNKLTSFEMHDNRVIERLNLEGNDIGTISFSDADNLKELNISRNRLESLDVHYSLNLKYLDASGNILTNVELPAETVIPTLKINDNNFTFSTLPAPQVATEYVYSPQSVIEIPTKGPGVNLSSENVTIDGNATVYTWFKADGSQCVEGSDYTITGGDTRFLNTSLGKVYCVLTNNAFPELSLRTSEIEIAGMPTHEIASFTTRNGGETAYLSLACASGSSAVYFDWTGNGDLTQYPLEETYTLYEATTVKDADVKVYTYGPEERVSVFSISGVTMDKFDGSGLKDATCLTLSDADLENGQIILPANPALDELNLSGCRLSDGFDLSDYPAMRILYLSGNSFSSFDFSPFKQLQVTMVDDNALTSVNLDNPALWGISLNNNRLESVDFSKAKQLEQVGLANNLLSNVDLSMLPNLRALNLVGNYFNFATLPLREANWLSYSYLDQADLDVKPAGQSVDLSFTAEAADGTPTEFAWYVGRPEINEDGILEGELLNIDENYTVDGATTTFIGKYTDVTGVLTNAAFEGLYLYTEPLSVTGAVAEISTEDISVSAADGRIDITCAKNIDVDLYSLNGMRIGHRLVKGEASFENLDKGIYLLRTPAGAYRVIVK